MKDKNNIPINGDSGDIHLRFNVPPEIRAHLQRLAKNELFIALMTDNYLKTSIQTAMELGTAIISNRTIGFLVKEGTKLPPKMEKVADEIVYFSDEDDKHKFQAKADHLYNLLCMRCDLNANG